MYRSAALRLYGRSAAVLLILTAPGLADNWPQWRGPELNGVSREKGLPVKWSPAENIAWKLPMPSRSGGGSPRG